MDTPFLIRCVAGQIATFDLQFRVTVAEENSRCNSSGSVRPASEA